MRTRRRRHRRSTFGNRVRLAGLALFAIVALAGSLAYLLIWLANPLAYGILVVIVFALSYLALRHRRQRRMRYRTLQDLLALSPTGFELAIADLLQDLGYQRVSRVGGAGDLAADITCVDRSGRAAVVQCKRYALTQRVGSPDIQKFIGMSTVHHHAQVSIFVTTTSFTEPARRLAQQHNIQLVDGASLVDLMSHLQLGGTRKALSDALVPQTLSSNLWDR